MTDLRKYPACIAAMILLWAASCTQTRQPCLTPKTASLILQTMHLPVDTSTIFIDTALTSAVFLPITTHSSSGIIYPLGSSFTISLSPDSTICKWAFATDTPATVFDTFTFYYQRRLQFLSNACGYTDFYTLDSVHTTHTFIDSLHLINTNVTNNVNITHVQVFIHPDF